MQSTPILQLKSGAVGSSDFPNVMYEVRDRSPVCWAGSVMTETSLDLLEFVT